MACVAVAVWMPNDFTKVTRGSHRRATKRWGGDCGDEKDIAACISMRMSSCKGAYSNGVVACHAAASGHHATTDVRSSRTGFCVIYHFFFFLDVFFLSASLKALSIFWHPSKHDGGSHVLLEDL